MSKNDNDSDNDKIIMSENKYNVKMMLINVKGLNERLKRRKIFWWLNNVKVDICDIHEAHSTADQEHI